jgi:DNA-directed RNA polymerase specialized sigma24 family protein
MRPDFEEELCERIDLEARLAALPDHLQEHVLMLRARLRGFTPGEIAEQFGVSRTCVRYRLALVLKHLGVNPKKLPNF